MQPHIRSYGLRLEGLFQLETAALALMVDGSNWEIGSGMSAYAVYLRKNGLLDPHQALTYNINGPEGEELKSGIISGLERLSCGDGPPLTGIAAQGLLDLLRDRE